MNKNITNYITKFEGLYNGSPWYGDSLINILDGVTEESAFWQASPDSHSMAEIISHMIYWRQALIKRLEGDLTYNSSMNSPKNWLGVNDLKTKGWIALTNSLDQSQTSMIELLRQQDDALLTKEFKNGANYETLIEGILQHDIYHIGQIALLKNIYKNTLTKN